MANVPDTNPIPDSIRQAFNVDPWAKLEAVVSSALEAAARGDIEIADAVAVIRVGILQARRDTNPIRSDGRIYADASRKNVPDSVVEESLSTAADELVRQAQELGMGYDKKDPI